jgi:DNA helicase-2/ATP-dependent DNA helicase PcrA
VDNTFQNNFLSEYQKLNDQQRQAVDTIDGPVMVIAGAGTGKTQTITLRIGKILTETQVNPNNILCLTFTENAAINMRSRLLSIIGPSAYSVRISTFHGFCNSVIKENPDKFLFSKKESVSLDEIKQIQIIRSLIDQLPATSSFKNINSLYFFQKDIIRSIQSLKKENIIPDAFEKLIKLATDFSQVALPTVDLLTQIRASKKAEGEIVSIVENLLQKDIDILYQTRLKFHLGSFTRSEISLSDLKREVKDFITKTSLQIPKQLDLLTIYRGYQQQLLDQNLFDFDDMILWVVNSFKTDLNFLANYQEKFQYILVDEFQDTNSSQMEIINLLTQSQESPNVFVVGDDDQSIFRFQGAAIENIFTFYQKYQSTIKVIALKNNYRSHRLILESSDNVIKNNQTRIANFIANLDKTLVATKTFDPDPINLFVANSEVEENFYIAQKIKNLIDSGTKPSEIAVLFRNNSDVDELISFLRQFQIRFLRSDAVNILENLSIQQLIDLFRYIDNPVDDVLLGKILSFKFLKIKSLDLYRLYHHSKNNSLSEVILNQERLSDLKITPKSQKKLSKFIKDIADIEKLKTNFTLPEIFNLVIRKFNYLPYVLKHQDLNLLKQLNALYSQLKNSLTIEKIDLHQWIENISTLVDNQISLNTLPLVDDLDQSIRLMTVHKSKGLEFEHVFLIKVLSGKWDSSFSRSNIKLPLGIIKTDIASVSLDKDIEEDRRLFYVALTRAKNQIYISYSKFNENGKELLPSVFINEIDQKLIQKINSNLATESESLISFFNPASPKIISLNLESYLKDYLAHQYRFNITHLNSYLKCPLCFFFKTILHLPQTKTRSLSFGTSVHGALAYLFNIYKKDNQLIPLEKFLSIFETNLKRESVNESDFNDLLITGRQMLTDYYEFYKDTFNGNCLTEHDFKFYGARLGDIPLTGKIDKMEILDNKNINVVDFKTGKPDNKYKELSVDGDYFRQLVFYKLLCQQSHGFPYHVKSGTIDFIQKDAKGYYKRANFEITNQHVADLSILITETYQKILNLEFAPSDQCDDPDHFHYLFEKYFQHEN